MDLVKILVSLKVFSRGRCHMDAQNRLWPGWMAVLATTSHDWLWPVFCGFFAVSVWSFRYFLLWLTGHGHGLPKRGPKTMTRPDLKALIIFHLKRIIKFKNEYSKKLLLMKISLKSPGMRCSRLAAMLWITRPHIFSFYLLLFPLFKPLSDLHQFTFIFSFHLGPSQWLILWVILIFSIWLVWTHCMSHFYI